MGTKAGKRFRGFREDPVRAELLALYREADQLLASFSCEGSTDCCHFGRTGREPYPTALEVAELELAVKAAGGVSAFAKGDGRKNQGGKRALSVVGEERRCPLLSSEGRCRIYASRPFGCRTFYCERASSSEGRKLPRGELQALGKRVAVLAAQTFGRDPGPRTLESALDKIRRGESVLVDRRST